MKGTPFADIVARFDKLIAEGQTDKATNQLHHISSHLSPQYFHSASIQIVPLFSEIARHVLPCTKNRNDKFRTRSEKFLNHWFHVFASFLPVGFYNMCKILADSSGSAKFMSSAISPFVENFQYCVTKEQSEKVLYDIVKEADFMLIDSLPDGTWEIIRDFDTEERVCNMINFYIDHNINEKGVSILIQKNCARFFELMFQTANLKFIDKSLKLVPKDVEFDSLTLSARISDSLFLDGGNVSLAYGIIPQIVKSNLDDIQAAAYRPFWTAAVSYLHQRNSTSCLYALHCGWKHNFVKKEEIIPFLKFDDGIEQRFRLASFQIGIDFFDEPKIQSLMIEAMKDIAMTRNNVIFCCLVDNLCLLYKKILNFDRFTAISIVNTVLNPIPLDDYLPIFVLKFLNSIDLTEPDLTFDTQEIIYKYMNIVNEEIAPEMRKLIHKIGMVVDFKKIDWFDHSIFLSLIVTDIVDPALIHELLTFDYIHISLVSLAIDLITKSGDISYFDYAIGTLIKVIKRFGFTLNNELEKYELKSLWYDLSWIEDSVLSHSFNKMSVPLPKSNLGKVAISLSNYIISAFPKMKDTEDIRNAVAIMSSIMACVDINVAINLFLVAKSQNKELVKDLSNNIIKKIQFADPIIAANFLLEIKGPEESLKSSGKSQIYEAISKDYNIANKFAPFVDQPLDKMPTFLAFEGIDKHNEWIESCKKEIPEENRILPKSIVPETTEEILEEKHFNLIQPVTIEKGIEGIGEGTRYDLIVFFYFSKKELPIPIKKVEKFVMEHSPDDIRLIIGFFYYAYNHGYHTSKALQWTKIIKFNRDETSLYAASLFLLTLTNIKLSSLPVYLTLFLVDGLKSIGYYALTKVFLRFAFRKEVEMRWFFIRSIISLDVNYFSDDTLITVEFADPSLQTNIFKDFFNKLPVQESIDLLMAAFISLTHVYFIPEKIVHLRPYPLAHVCLYHLKYIGGLPPSIKLDDSFINAFLSAMERQPFFPVVFFTFFAHVRLSDEQFRRVHALLEPRTSSSGSYFRFMLPAAYFDRPDVKMQIDERAAINFSNKPPSYSRAFYRSTLMPFTPMFPQKLIVEIYDLLCPVFPPFSYNALNTWDKMNNFDKIIFQKYPANALEKFKIVSRETVDIYRSTMCDPLYKQRKDITREVVKAAFSAQSSPDFALDIVNAILSMGHGTGFKDLLHEPEIVNMPNFLCFCLVFCHADAFLKMPNLKAEVAQLIEDPERKEIFLNLDQKQYINKLIHPPK